MKYGIITHNYGEYAKVSREYNVGDTIQTLAMEKIYKKMGIEEREICYINLIDLKEYDGEYVLLPMYSVALGINFAPLPLSNKIIPIFISSHIAIPELDQEQVEYLKSYAPIGCRDEYTLNTMRKYRIPAYLSGCMTVVFEKRKVTPKKAKIYLVDIPKTLKNYIPEEIWKYSEEITHMIPLPDKAMNQDEARNLYEQSKNILSMYKQKATLVISSKLHVLVPCIAMGIPVIAAFDNISHRFSWLDKYIKLYTPDEFDKINWTPEPVDYESDKEKIERMFCNQIKKKHEEFSEIYDISNFYEDREKALYGNHYYSVIKKLKNKKADNFKYIIWGCGLIGNSVYKVMQDIFPQAELIMAVDEYVSGEWHGVQIIKSQDLEKFPNAFVILASYSGRHQGYEVMQKLNRIEWEDFVYVACPNG